MHLIKFMDNKTSTNNNDFQYLIQAKFILLTLTSITSINIKLKNKITNLQFQ